MAAYMPTWKYMASTANPNIIAYYHSPLYRRDALINHWQVRPREIMRYALKEIIARPHHNIMAYQYVRWDVTIGPDIAAITKCHALAFAEICHTPNIDALTARAEQSAAASYPKGIAYTPEGSRKAIRQKTSETVIDSKPKHTHLQKIDLNRLTPRKPSDDVTQKRSIPLMPSRQRKGVVA